MTILIADDDAVSRLLVTAILRRHNHDVISCGNGREAWPYLQSTQSPLLAILDWEMPGLDGVDLCRQARELPSYRFLYFILLTARTGRNSLIEGLDAGAHDYITKPFDPEELIARVRVGQRVISLQQNLAERVRELEDALSQVKQLRGLLPICSYCKNIRSDENYWHKVEHYISAHTDVQFSHSICPRCYTDVIVPQLEAMQRSESF